MSSYKMMLSGSTQTYYFLIIPLFHLVQFEQDGKSHYSLIKMFSRLFRSQITSKTNGTILICKKCLFTKNYLKKHIKYCSINNKLAVKMPAKNTTLKFENHYKQLPIPFVVYADFECFTKQLQTCNPNHDDSFTTEYQKLMSSEVRPIYIQ